VVQLVPRRGDVSRAGAVQWIRRSTLVVLPVSTTRRVVVVSPVRPRPQGDTITLRQKRGLPPPIVLPLSVHVVSSLSRDLRASAGAVRYQRRRSNLFTPVAFPQLLIELQPLGRYELTDYSRQHYALTESSGGRYIIEVIPVTATTETTNSVYLTTTEDQEFEAEFTRRNTATGELEPATGLTGLTYSIAATAGGAAIGALTFAAAERGVTGRYYAIGDTVTLVAGLSSASYPDGTTVYLVLTKPGDVESRSWRKIVRRQRVGDG
jgi:hypothetical protein